MIRHIVVLGMALLLAAAVSELAGQGGTSIAKGRLYADDATLSVSEIEWSCRATIKEGASWRSIFGQAVGMTQGTTGADGTYDCRWPHSRDSVFVVDRFWLEYDGGVYFAPGRRPLCTGDQAQEGPCDQDVPLRALTVGTVVIGTVSNQEGQPIAGAQVFVSSTQRGTLTSREGDFRIVEVPVGRITVTAQVIGYRQVSQTLDVRPAVEAVANFTLEEAVLELEDIVVTGVAGQTPRIKLPFAVETIDPDDVGVRIADAADLLAGRAPGVTITGSGQPGGSGTVTLRGPNSIDATGESALPLIVIDGVIQAGSVTLDDVGTLDIDHVEIVKGAAAASLYGSRAQNGVIQINTKRGLQLVRPFDVSLRMDLGLSGLERSIPLRQRHPWLLTGDRQRFLDSNGNAVDITELGLLGDPLLAGGGTPATAFQDQRFPQPTFDQFDRFFSGGSEASAYAALTGRVGQASGRVSVDAFRETGIIACDACLGSVSDDGYRRLNLRANLDLALVSSLDLSVSAFLSDSKQDDSAVNSGALFALPFTSSAFDLTSVDEDGLPRIDVDPLSATPNPLYQLAVGNDTNERSRMMGSVDLSWAPLDWFDVEISLSHDATDFTTTSVRPSGTKMLVGPGEVEVVGARALRGDIEDRTTSASATLGADGFLFSGDLSWRARARYLTDHRRFSAVGSIATLTRLRGVTDEPQLSLDQRSVDRGMFFLFNADFHGRYIVDALVRRDGTSLFAPSSRWHTYGRMSAAWRVSEEPFWSLDFVEQLKLRASIGTSGGIPNVFAQFETVGMEGSEQVQLSIPNPNLEPELTVSGEIGVDLQVTEKLEVQLTYFSGTTDRQLFPTPVPEIDEATVQWRNVGEVRSSGIESTVRWRPINTSDLDMTVQLNAYRGWNGVSRLDVPPFVQAERFYIAEGQALGALWGTRWASDCREVSGALGTLGDPSFDCSLFQVNDDGYMVFVGSGNSFQDGVAKNLWGTTATVNGNEVSWGMPIAGGARQPDCLESQSPPGDCPVSRFLPLGTTTPDATLGLSTSLTRGRVSLSFLLSSSLGHHVYNEVRQAGLRDLRSSEVDQIGKPEGLKKPLAYYTTLYDDRGTNSHFVESASWVKLRDVSLTWTLPEELLERLFRGYLRSARLTVGVRNLFTITGYSGLDPEVAITNGTLSSVLNRVDVFQYPNFRSWSVAVGLGL